MKYIKPILLAAAMISSGVEATNHVLHNLKISFIRTVGNYSAGTTFDNTIELHFSTPLQWPAGSSCTSTGRVMIDAANQHMISAAYLAYTSDLNVTINADDTLPIRAGACE
ncbi:hypothetical protein EYS14_12845 [Alteromonadaceae bacterium M269]|nr:hypothetical protein EYS14_12845 [Alteromonadaceae bacterium M269]